MNNLREQPTDAQILASRPPRNVHDPTRPVAYFVEQERTADGTIAEVATLLLTNRECPFRCVMCDLWKNTLTERVAEGDIPRQIDFALARMPAAHQIKLYNSGSFFDRQAIPAGDYPAIAQRLERFARVIVENHPRFCGPACGRFAALLPGQLEVAIGLETVQPDVLRALNKRMTLDDFSRAVDGLLQQQIRVRAFILLQPPFLPVPEAEIWAVRSLEFAFARGVECCTVIPTRGGNGVMDQLARQGQFTPPRLTQLERVLEQGLRLNRDRVFADLWEAEKFSRCSHCVERRLQRLQQMNLTQQISPVVNCSVCGES
jgi:radical SAM enzyme (TIGR01210 family)